VTPSTDSTLLIQVSDLYAGFIRSGRRKPHSAHWLALAKQVGIQL
jgi:hypothetical protein